MYSYSQFISSSDRLGMTGYAEQKIIQWSQKFQYPVEDIIRAVQEVGFDKDEVEEYIRDRYNRAW